MSFVDIEKNNRRERNSIDTGRTYPTIDDVWSKRSLINLKGIDHCVNEKNNKQRVILFERVDRENITGYSYNSQQMLPCKQERTSRNHWNLFSIDLQNSSRRIINVLLENKITLLIRRLINLQLVDRSSSFFNFNFKSELEIQHWTRMSCYKIKTADYVVSTTASAVVE